jgi:cholesterol transport system auxiliary component
MKWRWCAGRAVLLLCAALSGCTGLFHSTAQPEQIYYLRAPAAGGAAAAAGPDSAVPAVPPLAVSLRVSHPLAAPGLDTVHIVLVQADHRMNFYAGSRWPAAAPDVVESLAVQTLRASGAWASVEDTASPFPSDYVLQIALRRFEADYTAGGAVPVVYVMLDCILGRGEGREVIATISASGSAAAAANRLAAVVAAFEQASGTALEALSQQAAQAARGDRARAAQNADSPAPSISRPSQ